jgi:hypothetical protein
MIRSCIKRLALLANLAGKGNLLVLTLLLVVLSSMILAYQAIYTREQAGAAPNTNINFQARILTNTGALVPDGNYSIQFKIYDSFAGPTSQWNETQAVAVKNGYVSVSLGSANPFSGIDWSQEQWLTMNINGDGEMAPRMKVTAVPFALRSNQADTLTNGSGTISASSLAQLAPSSVQSINSANSLLRIAQLGAGDLLQLQNSGGDKFTVANNGNTNIGGSLSVTNGVTVGNSSSTTAGTIRWTGSVFEGYNGTAWTSLGGSALGNPIINKVKLADEVQNSTVNATATLQPDDELFFSVGANETWTFRFMLQANSNVNPDFKFAVTAPTGATCKVSTADHEAAVSVANLGCGVSTGLVTGNTTNDLYEVVGTVTNGANAGTVQLQWAQNTANAANSTIYAGSSVLATRAVGPNGSAQAFIQNGNSFGADAYLGTNDNNNLNFITNGTTKMTVLANGNVGIGDSTPSSLLTVGNSDAFQVDASGNVSTSGTLTVSGLSTFNNSIVAGATATGTVSATEPTPRTNVTNVITTTAVFANNDVIFINNSGQDYYTRVVSGGGTTNLVVSPAVSYDASAPVTKYNVQNIGATSTDYSTQANRFFQGYFLGGVVIGAGSTTISDGSIDSTTTLRLQQNGGALDIGGNLNIAGSITGNGSGLTNIDGSQISGGSIQDTSLSANVTLQGNTFNGASQLLQLNGSGKVDDSLLSSNITALGNTFNGVNQLVQLNGSGYLPALNASNLTNINASNISSGTLDDARLSSNVTVLGNTFNGASQLVQLNGSGALPALSGANLTSLNASNISSGTLDTARLSTTVTLAGNTFNGASQLVQLTAGGLLPALNASSLTSINASNISSGTLDTARLSSTVTLAGNSFNGVSQLIQLNSSGEIPALSGANLTNMNATNISSGTINDGRLSSNVCLINSDACGYIRLASGTAQSDSTTNSSIFINKTGATGDLVTLQDNSTSVFRVANDGSLEIRQTSATALTIKNASGTDFFNVDTSGAIVRIGSATADGTGTLLVLDTKNTAGDPTGVNGGMYYSSVDGKNRCYENGVWVDCITTKLAGETTLGSASGTISLTLNDNYEYLECRMDIVSRSAASIPYLRFNNNTGGTSYTWNTYGIVAAATTDWQDASDSEVQLTGTQTGTNIISADMKITNLSGSNKVVDWTAAGVEAVGTNSNRYSGVGGFYSTAQVTSIQIVASTGTFGAGSHVWCQGKNVR